MAAQGITWIARNAFYLAASRWVTVAIRLVYLFVLTQLLGPELYGFFAYAQSWYIALLPLTSFGMHAILPREVGLHGASAKALIDTSLSVRIASALGVATAAIVIGTLLEDTHELRVVLVIVTASLPARALWYWCATLLTAFEQARYDFWFNALFRLLELSAGALVLLGGGGLVGVALTHLVVWYLNAVAGLWLIHRRFTPLGLGRNRPALKMLLRQGIPMSVQSAFLELLTSGPIVVYRHFAENLASLGQLALAFRMLNVFASGAGAAMSAAIPAMSRSLKAGGRADRLFLQLAPTLMLIGGTLISIVILALGEPVVLALFGADYAGAASLLGGLAFAVPLQLAAMAIGQSLFVRGHIDFLVLATAGSVACLLVMMLPLMSYWGLEGVVVAVIAARLLHMLLQAGFAGAKGLLPVTRVFLKPMLTLAVVTGGFILASRSAPMPALIGVIVVIGIYLRVVMPWPSR
jgi:O-antigen/teichoic acid export membrane protein